MTSSVNISSFTATIAITSPPLSVRCGPARSHTRWGCRCEPLAVSDRMWDGGGRACHGAATCQARITAVDCLQERLMLVPHRTAQADGVQHRPHGAADMGPVMVGGLGDERIARS